MAGSVDELTVLVEAVTRNIGELRTVARDIAKIDAAAGNTAGFNKFNSSMNGSIKSAVAFGAGLVGAMASVQGVKAALGGTIGAAIAFESSFAGIRKTVDATEEEFDALAKANRSMAKEIPATANEINRVGEIAGQLGVKGVANIAKFERVIIDLANTTDLTADTAATAFAKFANVIGLPISQIDRLGAAVVELGNNGESTESQIAEFAQRIAGAGKIAGLSAADITGIGSAFANTGVEAEAGGTAIQKVLIEMTRAAATGSDELTVFAETAGLSVKAFQDLAKSDPSEAFTLFVEGLGKAGNKAFGILEQLGLEDQRLIRSFLSVASAGDDLRNSIDLSNTAFQENTALTAEAEKRYATTAAQLTILKNNLIDVGISIGDRVLPALNKSAAGAADLVDAADSVAPVLEAAAHAAILFGAAIAAVKITQFAQGLLLARTAGLTFGAALTGMTARVGLLAIGLVALNEAVERISGQSIIDLFKLSDEKAAGASKSVNEFAAAMQNVQSIGDPFDRQTAGIALFTRSVTDATAALQGAQAEAHSILDEPGAFKLAGFEFDFSNWTNDLKDAREEEARFEGAIDGLIKQLPALAASFENPLQGLADLENKLKAQPAVLARLQSPLSELRIAYQDMAIAAEGAGEKAFRAAMEAGGAGANGWAILASQVDEASTALEDTVVAADAARAAQDTLSKAVELAASSFEAFNPVTEQLKLQIIQLENQKRAAEGAGLSTEELDHRLAVLNGTLAGLEGVTKEAQQQIHLYAAALVDSGVSAIDAAALVKRFADQLALLPEEERIAIGMALPDLQMQRLLNFLDLISQGISVPIALAIAGTPGKAQDVDKGRPFLGGTVGGLPGFDDTVAKNSEQAWLDAAHAAAQGEEAVRGAADAFTGLGGGGSGGGGGAAGAAAEAVDILSDGVIDFMEAAAAGLSPAQAAAMELARAADVSRMGAAATAFEFQKLAETLGQQGITGEAFQLQLALKAIQDELVKSGRSVTEFLRDVSRDAVSALKDSFGGLFGSPTKEGAALDLEIARKNQERAILRANGASDEELEAVNNTIDALRTQADVLDSNADVLKAMAVQADQMLMTEDQREFAAALHIIAIGRETIALHGLTTQAALESIARQGLIDAYTTASVAIQEAAGIDFWTPEKKAYVNAVARQKGEQEPFPGLQQQSLGRIPVVYPQLGTPVAAASHQLTAGTPAPGFQNYGSVTIQVRANNPDEMMSELDRYFRS